MAASLEPTDALAVAPAAEVAREVTPPGQTRAAVVLTLAHRGWQVVAGGLSAVLVARRLTAVEQGVFFTFGSLTALQVVAELGLTTVLIQFTAHEMARLRWTGRQGRLGMAGELVGDAAGGARVRGLVRFALRWYAAAAALLAVALVPAGLAFLGSRAEIGDVRGWAGAWAVLVGATAVTLAASPVIAMMEGSGRVADVARVRLGQEVLAYGAFAVAVAAGAGVASLAVLQGVRAVVEVVAAWIAYRALAGAGAVTPPAWRAQLWPMQWRIAVSWVSGYFVFQLFNPIAYTTLGSAAAGRLGLGIAMVNAVTTVSMSLVNARVPSFGPAIARRDFARLNALFARTAWAATALAVAGMTALVAGVVLLGRLWPAVGARVLAVGPLSALALAGVVNVAIFAIAAYVRAFKEEPMLVTSVVGAVLTPPALVLGARLGGLGGMTSAYLALDATLGLGMAWFILRASRRRWQGAA